MSECVILITAPGEEIVKFSLLNLLLSVTLKYPPKKIFVKEARNNKFPIYRTVSNASSCCNTNCTQYSACTLLAAAKLWVSGSCSKQTAASQSPSPTDK
jgi:hypothetical protein